MLIGVVSDTHGYIDPRAFPLLEGVELILHAGDVGNQAILDRFGQIAPVHAVRGNTDTSQPLARRLPARLSLELEGVPIFMTHIGGKPELLLKALPDPRPRVYIFGHTHEALHDEREGVLFLNPGAVGRPRFGGGLSIALLELKNGAVSARILTL